ncbi:MAG: hypothetical protein KF760_33270 [Candidatus Eremiobacteraeota bacterium]|nr:hypothetical protein [Candidatus Eremiobacteraeota bacterium]MCW5869077.1 hypothetical protein [Candidatus Eremiobacteraeota bacterium]
MTHGQVIATLSFGFWVDLTEAKYSSTLWGPFKLYKVFPGSPRRLTHAEVNNFLKPFRNLRNCIAHHEPIFARDFFKDQDEILMAIRWICPASADWAERLRVKPQPGLKPTSPLFGCGSPISQPAERPRLERVL